MNIEKIEDLQQLDIDARYLGEVPSPWNDDKKTFVDQWLVTIKSGKNQHCFNYFTGLGLRDKFKRPKKPRNANILHSLLLDTDACGQSFNDWCDNFGYGRDSIKAFNTYKACLENGEALLKLYEHGIVEKLRDILQDY